MTNPVAVDGVWKSFRLYKERNQYLKSTILRGSRSTFKEFWALKDVSFDVPEGSTFGIVGSNGSGKSTLLKCLAGILHPERGGVRTTGRMSALLELGAGFHPDLSGRENIYLNGAILGMTNSEINNRLDDIIDFSGLEQFVDVPVKNYSSGMVVRLGFAIAINVEPETMLIDEVLAVGDASFQNRCYEKIEQFRKDGRTIILVSHGLSDVQKLCGTALWLDKGEVRELGAAAHVINNYSSNSQLNRITVDGELGERWGTGEGSIEAVDLLDTEGKSLSTVGCGAPVTIRVRIHAHEPIPRAVVGINITHLHGTQVWGCNTQRRGLAMSLERGPAEAVINIPRWPLLEGTYELSVSFSDESEVHEFDHWEKRIRFDVQRNNIFEEGLVSFESGWHFTQVPE